MEVFAWRKHAIDVAAFAAGFAGLMDRPLPWPMKITLAADVVDYPFWPSDREETRVMVDAIAGYERCCSQPAP